MLRVRGWEIGMVRTTGHLLSLKLALLTVAVRSLAHGALAFTERYQPETGMAVLGDLPTIVTYSCAALAGYARDIKGFVDVRFFVIGTLTWFTWAFIAGVFIDRYLKRARGS